MGGFFDYLQGREKKERKTFCANDVSINRPKSFSDIRSLLDSLMDNEGFIVDFEGIDTALAQRMLDFLSGAVYAIGGKIEHIKQKMYIILPKNKETKKTKGKI
ncbi:MAG: cell division protein SepF [Bacillota bacterium]|jgi:cell division inhibitor SepF|nr:cell division protein SepF [Bacillota bacterium]HHU43567.1 cell division protein SepF [Clostridiales bacterium]